MGKSFSTLLQKEFVVIFMCGGIFQKRDDFPEGLNSDCHTFLIYIDTLRDRRTNQGTPRLLNQIKC